VKCPPVLPMTVREMVSTDASRDHAKVLKDWSLNGRPPVKSCATSKGCGSGKNPRTSHPEDSLKR